MTLAKSVPLSSGGATICQSPETLSPRKVDTRRRADTGASEGGAFFHDFRHGSMLLRMT